VHEAKTNMQHFYQQSTASAMLFCTLHKYKAKNTVSFPTSTFNFSVFSLHSTFFFRHWYMVNSMQHSNLSFDVHTIDKKQQPQMLKDGK
jgi:hypothetical protein